MPLLLPAAGLPRVQPCLLLPLLFLLLRRAPAYPADVVDRAVPAHHHYATVTVLRRLAPHCVHQLARSRAATCSSSNGHGRAARLQRVHVHVHHVRRHIRRVRQHSQHVPNAAATNAAAIAIAVTMAARGRSRNSCWPDAGRRVVQVEPHGHALRAGGGWIRHI